ncbi:WD40-repeat-containing domain protein [Haematococcus lacustris]
MATADLHDGMSPAVVAVFALAGVSGLAIVAIVSLFIARIVHSALKAITPAPSKNSKPKPSTHVKTEDGLAMVAPTKERGPDLKTLMKEQTKGAAKKVAAKDEHQSHHPLFLNTLKGHGDVVNSAVWSSDGMQLVTSCEDMLVRVFELTDVTSREPKFRRVKASKLPLGAGFGDTTEAIAILMKGIPEGLLALYAPSQQKETLGNYEQQWLISGLHGKEAPMMMRSVSAAASLAKRSVLVACSTKKDVRVYSAQGRELAVLEPNSLANHNLALSNDGRFVAVASFTAEVKLWELKWARDTGEFKGAAKAMELKGHKSQVLAVAFSPDAKRCVSASKDGTLRVWNIDVRYTLSEDPKTLLVIAQPLAQNRCYQHLAFGPNNLIAASWEGTVHLLDAGTGELLESIDAHDAAVTSMAWCPRLVRTPGAAAPHPVLATSSKDKRVRLWKHVTA